MTSPRRHWRAPHFDRINHEPVSWVYRTIAHLARNIVPLLGRTHWSGGEHIPKTGPVIVVANHIGNFDPIILGQYLIWQGTIWNIDRDAEGWRPYNGGGMHDPSDITGGHYDHLHITVKEGAL